MTATLVVVVPEDLASGFRLAGATVESPADADEAAERVRELFAGGDEGVIAVYEPWLQSFSHPLREHLEGSISPVVVPLPSGLEAEGGPARRARLAALLQRAVGYHITFEEEAAP